MNRRLQILALVLWVLSLVVPTLPDSQGGVLLGYQLLGKGAGAALMLPFSLFFPGHLLCVASNFLVARELFFLFSPVRTELEMPSLAVLGLAFLLNLVIGLSTLGDNGGGHLVGGLLTKPGYYVWLSSFFVLMLARMSVSEADSSPEDEGGSPASVTDVKHQRP